MCYSEAMDINTLTTFGLNEPQAKTYLTLVQYGPSTPPALAKSTGETRTNAYKILEQLEALNLVSKVEKNKKLVYRSSHPVELEKLAKIERDRVLEKEKQVRQALPSLLNFYHTYSEQPGVRFFQGQDGLREIFDDMLRTQKEVYLIRSPSDVGYYDKQFFQTFQTKKAKLGIKTIALTPDHSTANRDPAIDEKFLLERTWLPKDAYTGASDWYVYGDKMAIISYGEEGIGMIIDSPLIAESFKQLFCLLQKSL